MTAGGGGGEEMDRRDMASRMLIMSRLRVYEQCLQPAGFGVKWTQFRGDEEGASQACLSTDVTSQD
jgi:hypothetical protein